MRGEVSLPQLPERVSALHRAGDPIGPLAEDHPLVRDKANCPACKEPINAGEFVTLVPLGPGLAPEEREKARAGLVYNAIAAVLHYSCATGNDDPPPSLGEAA
jgi:hypothetical protein